MFPTSLFPYSAISLLRWEHHTYRMFAQAEACGSGLSGFHSACGSGMLGGMAHARVSRAVKIM